MRFVVLIYHDEVSWQNASAEEQEAMLAEFKAFADAAPGRGTRIEAVEVLRSTAAATTVRRTGRDVLVTEGPFAETAEHLTGFYVLDAPDLDTAVELVTLLPEYTIEIRPIEEV